MKKFFLSILLFLFVSSVTFAEPYNEVALKSLSALSVGCKEGVSAPFAGVSNDALVVIGGCNFPNIAAADGGEKVFYDKIFVLQYPFSEKSNWEEKGTFPSKVAYGASVSTPKGIVCIGGNDGEKSLSQVWLVEYVEGEVAVKELQSLPIALDNMTAAFGGDVIYVSGGQSGGESSNRTFTKLI